MKKVIKFVKGKKDERKESGGMTPSQSGDLISPAQTPEDERFLGLDTASGGYLVDLSGKDKTLTKLHKAAWQGNLEKLKSALKKVDVDAVDRHNRTALHLAVVQGHPNIVWFLLGNNAATSICDDDGCTPLLKAIECGHKECFKLLLERGTDINVADYTGNTGLHIAVKQGSLDTVSDLLSKAANVDVSNNAGDYPLHIATKSENKDLVNMLLNAGADVNVVDRENRTPLMLASKNGNKLLVDIFVESGATLTMVDSNGWTADDYALLGGHEVVASSLKALIADKKAKLKEAQESHQNNSEESSNESKSKSESWTESASEATAKKDHINKKLKEIFTSCSKEEGNVAEKEKEDEISESPTAQVIPPFCQPPRSWDMIQAGMIDSNRPGIETKRLSLTALGTLRSRRESFTEAPSSSMSPKHTHSLNRRKDAKSSNAFAKQRLSFNEDVSFRMKWTAEASQNHAEPEPPDRKESQDAANEGTVPPKKPETSSESDWDSDTTAPKELSLEPIPTNAPSDWDSTERDGTLGRPDTMKDLEEIWVDSTREATFPPPPSALELGADMAKSLKYMKGVSEDYPIGSSAVERNLWKNAYESHSLDCLDEKTDGDITRADSLKEDFRQQSTSSQRWKSQEITKSQKPPDRIIDVNRRINEQLECYDQALRELAESSTAKKPTQKLSNSFNYYSLPSSKIRCNGDSKTDLERRGPATSVDSGPFSAPLLLENNTDPSENNEKLGLEDPNPTAKRASEATDRKTKRDILMAMRDIKHAVQVSSAFKTSFDDQILSPLTKPEGSFEVSDEGSGEKMTSPLNGGVFFSIGRQETVLERKSSSEGTGDEPTLWLQTILQKNQRPNGSVEDVEDIPEDRGHHKKTSSFSPLGVIHREIQKESENGTNKGDDQPVEINTLDDCIGENPYRNHQLTQPSRRDDDESRDPGGDQSPDISLSSGPIEPLGTEKDSGSDPETSHNDITPTHNYSLKDQHEWLKQHLKTATSEKNKLGEIAAQLSEKAERLQYELADAREATKSRDEVIKLLQEQLSRMETAYTKSLEESVQSRLQLTSHEQEILHLKEICFKYEEEKTKEVAETEGQHLEKLQMKIKRLEGEKEKMREEIVQLETERSSLAKRLKEATESEILDQCQRWKERCEREEQEGRERNSGSRERERQLQDRIDALEKRLLEVTEENQELSSKYQRILGEVESEKKILLAKREINESIGELKRKNEEMEHHVKRLEKELEDKMTAAVREKEKEIQLLAKEFSREKETLAKIYEKQLAERKTNHDCGEGCRKEGERLRETIGDLKSQLKVMEAKLEVESAKTTLKNEIVEIKDQCDSASKSVAEKQTNDFNFLLRESMNLKKAISDMKIDFPRDGSITLDFQDKYIQLACENIKMKNLILDLKNRVNTLTLMVEGGGRGASEQVTEGILERKQKENNQNGSGPRSEKRRGIAPNDRLAWTNLYGIKTLEKARGWKSEREDDDENSGNEQNEQMNKLELARLKREIAFLQNKMADEKTLREALENQITEISRDLKEKELLQQEIQSLKAKITRDYIQKFDLELVQYQKELHEKREKYLTEDGDTFKSSNDDYRAKCQILAKEREKSKELSKKISNKTKLLDSTTPAPTAPQQTHNSPYPELPLQSPFSLQNHFVLEPEVKHHLEKQLDKSIRRYKIGTSSPRSSSSRQYQIIKEKRFL